MPVCASRASQGGAIIKRAQLLQLAQGNRRAGRHPGRGVEHDARAGGATEADKSGATLEMIQGALTPEYKKTSLRYIRHRSERVTGAGC